MRQLPASSNTMSRRTVCAALALGFGAARAQPAASFVARKPVTVIMPVGPGGALDFLLRSVSVQVSTALGQQLILDYKPGANGVLSTQQLRLAPADGHTFTLTYPGFVMNPFVMPTLPYDTNKDFQPVALIAKLPLVIAVNAQLPIHTMAELIAYGKANPGKLSVGISGTGGLIEYGMESLKERAVSDLLIVPFKGGNPAINAVIAGDVSMTLESFPSLDAHAKSGKLRLIAVTSMTRQAFAPAIPTVNETLPGFEIATWYGLIAAAGSPPEASAVVAKAFDAALRDPSIAAKLVAAGWEPITGNGPAEFAAFLASETKRLEPLARKFGNRSR